MRSILILVPLLGVTYMFFLFPPHPSVSRAWKYINAFLSSTQVSIISIRSFLAVITRDRGRKLLFAGYLSCLEAEGTKSCHLFVAEGRNLLRCEERVCGIERLTCFFSEECWVRAKLNLETGEGVEEMKGKSVRQVRLIRVRQGSGPQRHLSRSTHASSSAVAFHVQSERTGVGRFLLHWYGERWR